MCYETGLKLMVIDDAIGTAHDHDNIIMSSVIIYMHYVNCTCARGVCALRALVIFIGTFIGSYMVTIQLLMLKTLTKIHAQKILHLQPYNP